MQCILIVPEQPTCASSTEPSQTNPPATKTDWTGPVLDDYTGEDYDTVSRMLLEEYNITTYKKAYTDTRDGYSDEIDEALYYFSGAG